MSETLRSLVEISHEIIRKLTDSEGLITPEIEALLEVRDIHLPGKIDGYSIAMDRLQLEEDYWDKKAKALQAAADSFSAARGKLKANIKAAMNSLEVDELKGEAYRFKLSKLKPKLVLDKSKIPEEYQQTIVTTTHEPDKEKIELALLENKFVDGAKYEDVSSLRIYINKNK